MDEVFNQMAKVYYMFGAQKSVPLVLRAPDGIINQAAAQHSQTTMQKPSILKGEISLENAPSILKGEVSLEHAPSILKGEVDVSPAIYYEIGRASCRERV